jgi:hypothetical protein
MKSEHKCSMDFHREAAVKGNGNLFWEWMPFWRPETVETRGHWAFD